jgi:hypothetical protein
MKYNKFLVKSIFTAFLAFYFVLMACVTDNSNNPTPEDLAAQLAADLNAIEAGSATATGATVKITRGIYFTELTVPADVTLDVTADGAALGLGNQSGRDVTLTVHGTIIAGPGQIRMEDCQDEATINGSGTIRLNSEGNLFNVEGNWNVANPKITLDGITLVGLEDNDQALVRVSKGGTLVMKSGVITGNGDWGVIIQEGGTVNNPYDNNNIVLFVGGTFSMEGGIISGNSGGGVNISIAGGSYNFTVEGGPVTVTNDATKGTGTFTMNSPVVAGASGNVSGNTREGQANNVYNDGGTVNGTAIPDPNSTNGLLW